MSARPDMRDDPMQEEHPEEVEATKVTAPETAREPIAAREDTMAHDEEMAPKPSMAHEDAIEPEPKPAMAQEGAKTADLWPDTTDLHQRFAALQSEFIDDPKGAVTRAEALVHDAVERLTRSMHERMETMHHGLESTNDTEQLRQTMRGYRDLVVWMETRRAA
jgi:hypothetical protein